MKRSNILAHRGLWTDPDARNSRAALRAALSQGFGVETDFRDSEGQIFVSHDPVQGSDQTVSAIEFFTDYTELSSDGRLALNIKSDGLQTPLEGALRQSSVPLRAVYAFDMSVPDTLGYMRRDFPFYTRVSEYEPAPPFLDQAQGIWVDDFLGDFPQVAKAEEYLKAGYRVAIVSPELHGRAPEGVWAQIKSAGIHTHPKLELCTDHPLQAYEMLGQQS